MAGQAESNRVLEDKTTLQVLRQSFDDSGQVYGSSRMLGICGHQVTIVVITAGQDSCKSTVYNLNQSIEKNALGSLNLL